MKLRFLFRADSGEGFGHGHSARVETLARAAKNLGHEAGIAYRRTRGQRRTADVFDAVLPLPARSVAGHADEASDAIDTQTAAVECRFVPDIVVVDHYGLAKEWEKTARSFGKFIVALDDIPDRPHAANLVIELVPNDSEGESVPGRQQDVIRIRGLEYFPVGHDFGMPPPDWSSPSRNVLVSFGGWDPTGGTLVACEALALLREEAPERLVTADIVIGEANQQVDDVRRFAASRPWLLAHSGSPSLAPFMRRSHLVICGAGNTLVEAVASGRAPISVIVADNQEMLARHLAHAHQACVLMSPDDVSPQSLADAIRESWYGGQSAGTGPIDMLGAQRCVAKVLLESGLER